MSELLLLLLLLLLLPPGGATSPVSCYNDRGAPVDWFYVYKLPRAAGGGPMARGPMARGPMAGGPEEGLRYLLLEPGSEAWAEGAVSINDTSGAVGRTLAPVYSQSSDVAFVFYNDQSPEEPRAGRSCGHTKGAVVVNKTQGLWLVHSTPHFPPPREAGHFSYPDTGLVNGQNFLCVTFPLERFLAIGEQLQINQPHVFDCRVPEALASLLPTLSALCHKPRPSPFTAPPPLPESVSNRSVTLSSAGGTDFISFAKGAAFSADLYHSWVAPALGTPLLVQFWVRSTGVLPSDCAGAWSVLNIRRLGPAGHAFSTSLDHSKWAASPGGAQAGGGWVCVGDINRNEAEERRGGGTVCQRDPRVWKAYRSAALQCQDCGGGTTTC